MLRFCLKDATTNIDNFCIIFGSFFTYLVLWYFTFASELSKQNLSYTFSPHLISMPTGIIHMEPDIFFGRDVTLLGQRLMDKSRTERMGDGGKKKTNLWWHFFSTGSFIINAVKNSVVNYTRKVVNLEVRADYPRFYILKHHWEYVTTQTIGSDCT